MKSNIIGIVVGIILTIGGIFGFYVIEKEVELYKPPIEELQDNLDTIQGVGDTLKIRIGNELYVWIDEINEINEDRLNKIDKYNMFMLIFSIIGLLFIIFNLLIILMRTSELHLIKEHRATQEIILTEEK